METTGNIHDEKLFSTILSSAQLIQIIVYVIMAFLLIIAVIYIYKKGKRIRVSKIVVGPFEAKIEDEQPATIPVHSIAILKHPTTISGNPAKLNTLKARVYDKNSNPLKGKLVTIEIDGEKNNTERYISGQLSQVSDESGYVFFSGLYVHKRGSFNLVFKSENVVEKARPFSVTPPGLDINFENKVFGSDEYTNALKLATSLSKGADRITINGEEIR